ncbi:double-strand break repair helicase AddA [Agaricicola taiwanensis]|uniref:DNA 3'-5' helicase n=1 Tax=Agaricicola taiwanensis TaxID=591372 RepID=A0A8J2VMG2_9RHOB|nr:double-strand break repair helicase AddA [Agaricicola taiwanensis]GGE32684.1 double-strand break repair helicase AddA [Agaricicola taiwanensis]
MSRGSPSDETVARQRRASDPGASAWVSANAGSGKTYVLAQRVVRLLLAGTPPGRILCLTFTKAAAANMANRVFGWLAEWTRLTDEELDERLQRLGEERPTPARRAVARRLFAQALETPGGLKILTIHGFCERVLQQFPFEANVTPRFSVLDDRTAAEHIAAAKAQIITRATAQPDSRLGRAMNAVIEGATDSAFASALNELLSARGPLARATESAPTPGVAGIISELAAALGVAPGDSLATIDDEVLVGIPAEQWLDLAVAFEEGTAADHKNGSLLRNAITATDEVVRRALYRSLFFTQKDEPRSRLGTKRFRDAFPAWAERLDAEMARLVQLTERRRAVAALTRTDGLLTLADAILTAYARAKAARGALDFDDLVAKTKNLFTRVPASWVLYKLDGGLDHVLVDEAQDTNPDQWEIVAGLTSEFTSGFGARGFAHRTVFAVGDEKQSIYGFQGAAPEAFDAWRRRYMREHQDAELSFFDVRLTQSFRSTPDVLDAVDHVFSRPEAYQGLEAQAAATIHETVRAGHPGVVEIWPLARAEPPVTVDSAWDAPFDTARATSQHVILAERIASAIRRWTTTGDPDAGRPPVSPGDILILVRSRGPLFEATLRALKLRGIPVAGADRLVLNEHIAVLDLLALGDAVIQPEDDLALASVLKSPLFGLSDVDLLAFAPMRRGSLAEALEEAAWNDLAIATARDRFRDWQKAARQMAPFDFFSRVLGRDGGRRAFRARLGPEADDVLDEFLGLALAFGRDEIPTMAGFLHWMRAAEVQIKRDLDVASGEVRVMTVHGAKGLEAKVVVLADSGLPPSGKQDACVLTLPATAAHGPLPVWSPRAGDDPAAVAEARLQARASAEAEHRRLLYVALTRAEDHLVIAGALRANAQEIDPQSWYALVRDGLAPLSQEFQLPGVEEPALRFRATEGTAEGEAHTAPALMSLTPPPWARTRLAPETQMPSLSPSAAAAHEPVRAFGGAAGPAFARARGLAIHRLAEWLPGLAADARRTAAERFLGGGHADLPPDTADGDAAGIIDEALALVADPSLAELFHGNARTEVTIAGRVEIAGQTHAISGRIDRLVEEADGSLLLIDLKTDRQPPAHPPAAYVAQLALYRALLQRMMPGRTINAALLWTALPRLERLPGDVLDAAIAQIVSVP